MDKRWIGNAYIILLTIIVYTGLFYIYYQTNERSNDAKYISDLKGIITVDNDKVINLTRENHNLKMYCNPDRKNMADALNRSDRGKWVDGLADLKTGIITVYVADLNITEVLDICTHEYAHIRLGMVDNYGN